jgi:apolipoprotein D and lipocalin family protein
MSTFYILILLVITPAVFSQEKPVRVVDNVDLEKYTGTWYEIARLPNRFQSRCDGDVTATYTLLETGQIKVVNRCRKEDGAFIEAEGRARRADRSGSDSKLKVRFAPRFLSFLPFVWGDYWIIDLDPEYRYAVVGDPGRKYLWILARETEVNKEILSGILERAQVQGYDVSELIMTKHTTD